MSSGNHIQWHKLEDANELLMQRKYRKLLYWGEQALYLVGYLSNQLVNLGLKGNEEATYKGITVYDLQDNPAERVEILLEALRVIEQYDPRRFRIVQKEIHSIIMMNNRAWANYRRFARMMVLEVARYNNWYETETKDWCIISIASIIIHEATHGYLYSRYIPYLFIRKRIERICEAEQQRFLARIPSEKYSFINNLASHLHL